MSKTKTGSTKVKWQPKPRLPMITRTKLTEVEPVHKLKVTPRDIFIDFVSEVHASHDEAGFREILESYTGPLKEDKGGNWYTTIPKPEGGRSRTLFCAHVDTVSKTRQQKLYAFNKDGTEYICGDEVDVLGADDRAGCTVLVWLMLNSIPGTYYFFMAEEIGRVGSIDALKARREYFKTNFDRAIQFDRKGIDSVITYQCSTETCSKEFAEALITELCIPTLQRDPTGLFTDTYTFIGDIPECTNVSAGYYDAHLNTETQNMTYLDALCRNAEIVDWESLPTVREPKPDYYDYDLWDNWGSRYAYYMYDREGNDVHKAHNNRLPSAMEAELLEEYDGEGVAYAEARRLGFNDEIIKHIEANNISTLRKHAKKFLRDTDNADFSIVYGRYSPLTRKWYEGEWYSKEDYIQLLKTSLVVAPDAVLALLSEAGLLEIITYLYWNADVKGR